ncbi:glycosyltransferase family 25 protein [Coniochaeta sp. 2T2.1]|nr:glycosyltransferase family 25 protein [Coniochaeta sp. 2T2.1]
MAAALKMHLLDDINNSTLGFEKILVVGMPARSDRRDGMFLGAALSEMEIEFVDSSDGTSVPDKALPMMDEARERPPNPVVGSWRGHVNAIREVVRRNLTSALIMEDDVDWDIHIRQQLRNFARSSRALTQPLEGQQPGTYADPTYGPAAAGKREGPMHEMNLDSLPNTIDPVTSPYGDDWDVLWFGHCGQRFANKDDKNVPKGRVVQSDDKTVAQKRYLGSVLPLDYGQQYPDHTRVVSHVQDGLCSLAYAVSQRGARALLLDTGLKDFSAAFDILLHWACSGEYGRGYHRCLTVIPGLIQHHRPAGPRNKNSDISGHGGMQEKPETHEIRYSVRLNAEEILAGGTNYVDQFPDVQ